jgi:hypothetical protein
MGAGPGKARRRAGMAAAAILVVIAIRVWSPIAAAAIVRSAHDEHHAGRVERAGELLRLARWLAPPPDAGGDHPSMSCGCPTSSGPSLPAGTR